MIFASRFIQIVNFIGKSKTVQKTVDKSISKKYKIILFDDLSFVSSYKRFQKAFYDNMITNIHARPFVVFIIQPIDDITSFADKYIEINIDYFSITEVMKLYPKLSKFDALGLYAMSGGIPKI